MSCSHEGCDEPAVYRLNPEAAPTPDMAELARPENADLVERYFAGLGEEMAEELLLVGCLPDATHGPVLFCDEHAARFLQDCADDRVKDEVETRARWHKEIVAEGNPKELETALLRALDELLVSLRTRWPRGMPPILIRV